MSTTLTNGLKLPDKGSVDWYADMQNNYTILDGAVGTVAEHTTQIAGKAPAVHTHTKADITDFPAYGNAAGTICEGNDSRLSDARTPVAHTHTKSDVTDLLNSNFIPSANNSYDLGSSSYQWNNLYAKNYYYNGVAWGLDKANVWTSWQTFENANGNALLRLRRTDIKIGDAIPSSQKEVGAIAFAGSDNINLGLIVTRDENSGHTRLIFAARQRYDSNGNRANNGTGYEARMDLGVDESRNYYLRPNTDSNISLGTSTNKWKTLNGINPGALSFPKIDTTENVDFINVIGNIDINTTASQTFTASATGWFCISFRYNEVTSCRISAYNVRADCVPIGSDGFVGCYIPVTAGVTVTVRINATAIYNARIYLCQGNV